jgi:AraC-like DNA-binding protein
MTSVGGPHRLKIANERDLRFTYTGNATPTSTVSLGYLEYGTDVTVFLNQSSEYYSVSLPINGQLLLNSGGAQHSSEGSKAIVISPGRQSTLDLDGSCRTLVVSINRRLLELVLRRLIGRPVTRPVVFDTGMSLDSAATASWWRTAEYYLRELMTHGSIFTYPNMGAEMELGLVRALLLSQSNNYSEELSRKVIDGLPEYFARARSYIEENYPNSVRIDDIERVSGVTSAKLCVTFREFTGTTPMGYLKRTRLDRARLELLNGPRDQKISSIAMDVGFNHLGRFSVEYKLAFDESPTETFARRRTLS